MEIAFIISALVVGFFIAKLLGRRKEYVGNIVVIKDPNDLINGKTIYSLEIDGNPEIIETKEEVTFRVLMSNVELDRE